MNVIIYLIKRIWHLIVYNGWNAIKLNQNLLTQLKSYSSQSIFTFCTNITLTTICISMCVYSTFRYQEGVSIFKQIKAGSNSVFTFYRACFLTKNKRTVFPIILPIREGKKMDLYHSQSFNMTSTTKDIVLGLNPHFQIYFLSL